MKWFNGSKKSLLSDKFKPPELCAECTQKLEDFRLDMLKKHGRGRG